MSLHKLNNDDFILDEIESIELIGDKDTIDITVDETHMFYANGIYTHNSSVRAEVLETDQMAGSLKKAMIAHFIVSVAKTLDQRDDQTATVAILKSRFGKSGIIFENVIFDNAKIQIEMGVNNRGARTSVEHKKDVKNDTQNRVNSVLEAAKLRKEMLSNEQIILT